MPTPIKILKFYRSEKWKRARNLKVQKEHGICEQCGKAGWEVHHKTPLTLDNIDNPSISLSLDNLELLCTSCHNSRRKYIKPLRPDVEFDKEGNIVAKNT